MSAPTAAPGAVHPEPLLVDVPAEILTDRLLIRPPLPGDGPELNAAAIESAAELQPWMPWTCPLPTVEQSEAYVRKAQASFLARQDLPYRAQLKSNGDLVVGTGLHRIDWSVPRFEIGYWCRTKYAGQGYVSEVVRALTQMAFVKLRAQRVEIRMDARNERSRRVAERCGYVLEAVLRCESRNHHGELRDTCIYARVADPTG
jgi:RimJ/RimL family protein N-acetyltransferase